VGYYTSLVQSVNLICAKKSITLIGLNNFFLCINSRVKSKFLKLVLDRAGKFGWMKQLVTILLVKVQSSAFVLSNL